MSGWDGAKFRPIGDDWRGERTSPLNRKDTPFRASWTDTKELLDRELRQINARLVVVQIDLPESGFRIDGQPRADARDPAFPGVILSFETTRLGPLRYQCDKFNSWGGRGPSWQTNLRAIGLGLEALRKVERYGIGGRGEQYTGWRAIGAATPMPSHTMNREEAARFMAEAAGEPGLASAILRGGDTAKSAFRKAAAVLHPDVGGDPELFKLLNTARDVLAA